MNCALCPLAMRLLLPETRIGRLCPEHERGAPQACIRHPHRAVYLRGWTSAADEQRDRLQAYPSRTYLVRVLIHHRTTLRGACAVPCYTPAMKRFPAHPATVLLIALLAVALSAGVFANVAGASGQTSRSSAPSSTVAYGGHDVLLADVADTRSPSRLPVMVARAAAPIARASVWSCRLTAGPSGPRSTAIALRLPPLRL